ncbi:hypothetical protein HanXRQr2_Chr09g0376971 [Helianthus annuus]|uniref:Uncharacterized protein n=1 Tax=Helianthus annuus TaxID=4232 RepID=A0A251SWB7_HELAN|nr:hypothetical protein HanXRQr2_Chr09g0376971 [Helianthus annuus]KAJ0892230.1 hypothetical protein HanPSC8_Chr09g0363441 [Helianthus annuus]
MVYGADRNHKFNHFIKSIMYIKTIHFGATWHNFNPLIATWQVNTPLNIDLSGNIHLLCKSCFSLWL